MTPATYPLAERLPGTSSGRPGTHTHEQLAAGGSAERRWLAAALVLSLLFAWRALAPAFGPGDVVADDARQHIFWMGRFRDPELFPNDLIADFYEAQEPLGYKALFWGLTRALDPLPASKVLPPLLGLAVVVFTFLLVRRLHPAPVAAFLATGLLSWYLWQHGDLTSATPREFLLLFLAVQAWALVADRLKLATGLVVLSTLFYPVAGLLGVALLGIRLLRLQRWYPQLNRERADWLACGAAAALVGAILLQGRSATAPYGPFVSPAQAREMPDFGPGGRVAVFGMNTYTYWLKSDETGLGLGAMDQLLKVPVLFELAALASLLPVLLLARKRVPAARRFSPRGVVLLQIVGVSFGLFFLAHLLIFDLYHPSRYVKWSLPLVLAAASGLALGILMEALADRFSARHRQVLVASLSLGCGLLLVMYPVRQEDAFRRDRHPTITAYLGTQPRDILIAGVPAETDSIPTFASRRVLTSREHMNPWYLGFETEMIRRTEALIEAYYAASPRDVADFASRYGVSTFLVNRAAFSRSGYLEAWRGSPNGRWEPYTSMVARKLERAQNFALLALIQRCAVIDDGTVAIVPTTCVQAAV